MICPLDTLKPANICQIVLLKPSSRAGDHSEAVRRFERDLKVKKEHIRQWLDYLRLNHPAYQNIQIDEDHLNAYPENGSIYDLLTVFDALDFDDLDPNIPESNAANDVTDFHPGDVPLPSQNIQLGDIGAATNAMVPDLRASNTEQERFRAFVNNNPSNELSNGPVTTVIPPFFRLSAASISRTPIDEQDKSILLFSMAFPTLFPTGAGDFNHTREIKLKFEDWIKHLIRYKDGRFARHSRFRYMAFNMLLRHKSKDKASYFCRRSNNEFDDLTDLANALAQGIDNKQFINRLSRHAAHLPGTRPFWNAQRQELEAMIYNIGCPHLFVTFSAADLHWPDLHQHMPRIYDTQGDPVMLEASEALEDQIRAKYASNNVSNNPAITADYLTRRFTAFFKLVLSEVFNISDHWYRFEWQDRGSGHIHGFIWLKDGPIPSVRTDNLRHELAVYWANYITAYNPDQHLAQIGKNPASVPFVRQQNTVRSLTEAINRFQRHKCTGAYCLRKYKDQKMLKCRFHFPIAHRSAAEISKDLHPGHYMFLAERNDYLLNAYTPLLTLGWLANIDITPCTSPRAVLHYIAKYASKSEQQSKTYKELLTDIIPRCGTSNAPLLSLAWRFMNSLLAERDWSAQEVMHILLDNPLSFCSRKFVDLNIRDIQDRSFIIESVDGVLVPGGKSLLEKYMTRMAMKRDISVTLDRLYDLTLLNCAQKWKFTGKNEKSTIHFCPRIVPNIVRVYPRPKWDSNSGDKSSNDYEDYCRAKLMLNVSFQSIEELKKAPNNDIPASFRFAWEQWVANHRGAIERDPLDPLDLDPEDNNSDEEGEVPDLDDEDDPQPDWAYMAGLGPNNRGHVDDDISLEAILGHRGQDLNTDYWTAPSHELAILGPLHTFYNVARTAVPNVRRSNNDPTTLQCQQRVAFDYILAEYNKECIGVAFKQLLLHIDGEAGTGKSYLIDMLSTHLNILAERAKKSDPVVRGAPTGVAAFNIQGRTLHSLLRLPVRGHFNPLEAMPNVLARLQEEWKNIRFFIIDEKSMIGLKVFRQIDSRLREIFPAASDLPFGGLHIILMGDFRQLAPVAEFSLFKRAYISNRSNVYSNADLRYAQELYTKFDHTIRLDQVMRQQGNDTDAISFREALQELRQGPPESGLSISTSSYNTLRKRWSVHLSYAEKIAFDSALRLFSKRIAVRDYNLKALEKQGQPVIHLKATHTGSNAASATDDAAEGLYSFMHICRGARMMLTSNLLTPFGLVNGTIGSIHNIYWDAGADPFLTLPRVILFRPDEYSGPDLSVHGNEYKGLVPILLQTRSWDDSNGQSCSRTMFPLVLAYAVTVHKAQGMTLDRVVLNIEEKDFAFALTYVAVSRVKSLTGLMFETDFTRERFNTPFPKIRGPLMDDERVRNHQLVR
jgi:ATP-dependent DNA helicase PIF1